MIYLHHFTPMCHFMITQCWRFYLGAVFFHIGIIHGFPFFKLTLLYPCLLVQFDDWWRSFMYGRNEYFDAVFTRKYRIFLEYSPLTPLFAKYIILKQYVNQENCVSFMISSRTSGKRVSLLRCKYIVLG